MLHVTSYSPTPHTIRIAKYLHTVYTVYKRPINQNASRQKAVTLGTIDVSMGTATFETLYTLLL